MNLIVSFLEAVLAFRDIAYVILPFPFLALIFLALGLFIVYCVIEILR